MIIEKFHFCWSFDEFSSYVKTILSLTLVPLFQENWESRVHQFLWYYLRWPLRRVFADYHLSGVCWFEWVILFFNSLAPRKFEWNFRYRSFKHISVIDGWGICCEIALIWMSLEFTDDQSTLFQVMAWCRQAASHYLSQYWPRSL